MKGMPFSFQGHQPLSFESPATNNSKKQQQIIEPCSVLDNPVSGSGSGGSPSPSPPTTSSSSLAGAASPSAVAALPKPPTTPNAPSEWASLDDLDIILSQSQHPPSSPTHDQSFLRWIMGGNAEIMGPQPDFGASDLEPFHSFDTHHPAAPLNLPPPPMLYREPPIDERPPQLVLPPPPKPKRHHSMMAMASPVSPLAIAQQQQQQQQQQQALVDGLFKAAELLEHGDSFGAREILARLNHQLPTSPSPLGLKPIIRATFLFKEVLAALAASCLNPVPSPISNPWDVVLKLSSYKSFSEVSPILHFTNFTCTQALLEEVGGHSHIHVLDFDIGFGGQWSSFMQELAHRRRTQTVPFLKITALVSASAFHPLELHLTRENLTHFAAELNIPFEFSFLGVESFDPNDFLIVSANESIVVNLPVGSHYAQPFPALLQLVRQLNPKIVVSVDQGCDRSDLPFAQHLVHSFQAYMVLLDSIDASGTNTDTTNKIERFLIQPRIEGSVLGRNRAIDKMPPWRAMFASLGFVPWQFSNFTEMQAECLLKRVQVRGFHVEKRQSSLFLYWQRGELGSVSAWKC